jgi:hypothetical protein
MYSIQVWISQKISGNTCFPGNIAHIQRAELTEIRGFTCFCKSGLGKTGEN